MAQYDVFAPFYDAVNGEPDERVSQILHYIEEFRPDAHRVLELGCGTGAILAGLGSGFTLTGLDISPEMLNYARRRCPRAHLVEGDITSFDLGTKFDVVVSVYDTINHVTELTGWTNVFESVARHLDAGGLFIFDLNTLGRLRDLGDMAPWVYDFEGNTLVMGVDFSHEPLARWTIRIFENVADSLYREHHEDIFELGVALDWVRDALAADFTIVSESDTRGHDPTDESSRALFVAQRS
jgi:SAM-dependent methyltransferase